MTARTSRLLALNDVRLADFLRASDEESRSNELKRILTEEVQPRARSVLDSYVRTDWPIDRSDFEDILGQVTLSILRKLRASTVLEEESIQNLEAYVITLTRNAVRDFMRRRSPERTRMKSRMRYLFSHDERLSLWSSDNVVLCGLAQWTDQTTYESRAPVIREAMTRRGERRQITPAAVVSGLMELGMPVRLSDLVTCLLDETAHHEDSALAAARESAPRDSVEARQYLQVLWSEIAELPPRQRAALLLNLREPGSGNAVVLFVAVGIASSDEIAAAIGMTAEGLSAIWDHLPFDDLRIAEHLQVSRQQVINLRKSARQRLTRRMSVRDRGRQ